MRRLGFAQALLPVVYYFSSLSMTLNTLPVAISRLDSPTLVPPVMIAVLVTLVRQSKSAKPIFFWN